MTAPAVESFVRRRPVDYYDERVRAMISLTSGPRVLHVGACGNVKPKRVQMPHFAQAGLVDAGFSVLATDINEDGLRWMRDEMGYEVAYLDAQRIDPEGEKFDTIFAGELIEHLPNPGLFLTGCATRLKDDGVLVLSTPNPFTLIHLLLYTFRFPRGFNPEHCCWFDRQTLEQLLAASGYAVRELVFVDDLRAEGRKIGFRLFAAFWALLRRLLPDRYRTTIVVAAERAPEAGRDIDALRASWR